MKKVVLIIFFILTAFIFAPKLSPIFAACVNGDPLHFSGCPPTIAGNTTIDYSSYTYQCGGTSLPKCCTSASDCNNVVVTPKTTPGTTPATPNTCKTLQDQKAQDDCNKCMDDDIHVWTAIGCVEATSTGLLNTFLPFAIGIAGGIAFLLILFGALQMMMSAGNPEKLNAGKELVTAAITGLLLIIFSIFILRLVGVTILQIPGFS